jgi:BssS protein family
MASWACTFMGLVIFLPHFLSHTMQTLADAEPSRHYVLTMNQVRGLISDLQQALHELDSDETQAPHGVKH